MEESIRDMKRNSLVPALPALVLLLLLLVFPAQAEEVPANMPAETVTAEQQAAPAEGQPEAPAAQQPQVPAEAPAEEQPAAPAAEQPEVPAEAPAQEQPTAPAEVPAAEQQDVPAESPAEEQPTAPAEAPATEAPEGEQPQGPAAAEPELPAGAPRTEGAPGDRIPADLCPHANVHEETFFDTPVYRPLDAETHSISGRAVVVVVCDDCGAELSARIEENAEEILPHVFRKGICALCGREEAASGAYDGAPVPAVQESTWPMHSVDGADNLFACSLTDREVADCGDILVLQPSAGEVVLALQARELLQEMEESGADLIAEIRQDSSRSISVSVRLSTPEGVEYAPDRQRITLRIYGNGDRESLDVTYTDPSGSRDLEEAGWVTRGDDGYWSVTWLGDGNYQY